MNKIILMLERIEKKLSDIVLWLWILITRPFIFILNKIKHIKNQTSEILQDCLRGFINFFLKIAQFLNSLIGPRAWGFYKHKISNFLNKVKDEKAARIKIKNAKATATATNNGAPLPVVSTKKLFFIDVETYLEAFFKKLSEISPTKFATLGFLFLVMMLNTFHFLSTSTNLVSTIEENESEKARRSIASSMEEIPDYYNNLARLSSIKSLKIPAFSLRTDKIKSLEVDAQILFYSRSAKQFFDNNMIIFIDHLEMTLEPVQPSFPLSPEGRNVLKEKIKYEIDTLLKQFHIESHVENVFFINVFAN